MNISCLGNEGRIGSHKDSNIGTIHTLHRGYITHKIRGKYTFHPQAASAFILNSKLPKFQAAP